MARQVVGRADRCRFCDRARRVRREVKNIDASLRPEELTGRLIEVHARPRCAELPRPVIRRKLPGTVTGMDRHTVTCVQVRRARVWWRWRQSAVRGLSTRRAGRLTKFGSSVPETCLSDGARIVRTPTPSPVCAASATVWHAAVVRRLAAANRRSRSTDPAQGGPLGLASQP